MRRSRTIHRCTHTTHSHVDSLIAHNPIECMQDVAIICTRIRYQYLHSCLQVPTIHKPYSNINIHTDTPCPQESVTHLSCYNFDIHHLKFSTFHIFSTQSVYKVQCASTYQIYQNLSNDMEIPTSCLTVFKIMAFHHLQLWGSLWNHPQKYMEVCICTQNLVGITVLVFTVHESSNILHIRYENGYACPKWGFCSGFDPLNGSRINVTLKMHILLRKYIMTCRLSKSVHRSGLSSILRIK